MAKNKALTLERILSVLKEHKHELEEKYGIKEIGIFGSYVKGKPRKYSDIDILIEFKPEVKVSLLDFIGIENYLSDLLGANVDLVEKSALKPRIGKHILNEVIFL